MLKVGLTGGVACGKSTVLRFLLEAAERHADKASPESLLMIDADLLVHHLYTVGEPVNQEVRRLFGESVVALNGDIDRRKLGEIVFTDKEKLAQLEGIVHKAVIEREHQLMDKHAARYPKGIAIVEATKMVEAGSHKFYDKVILVTCSPEAQLERFAARHCQWPMEKSRAELDSRRSAQLSHDQRLARVKNAIIIDTSGEKEQTAAEVENLYLQLLREAQK